MTAAPYGANKKMDEWAKLNATHLTHTAFMGSQGVDAVLHCAMMGMAAGNGWIMFPAGLVTTENAS